MNLIQSEHPMLLAKSDPWREDKWGKNVLEGMADEAFQVMKENNGVGLAMNQVGVDCASFIIDGDYLESRMGGGSSGKKYYLFCNPKWVALGVDTSRKAEGCLSLDGKYKVKRAKRIFAEWYNPQGIRYHTRMSGDLARCFQHEYDHTQGILINNKGKIIK